MSTVRKIRCTVERIADHGDRVYTVDLKPERPVPVFRPGQFLHLALDAYDPSGFWPESRVFSIASSPAERNRLTVIYSVKGQYTSRMEQELCVGRGVWVKLPYGEFVVDGGADAVLIAGGTGITAFQAFIEGLPPDHPNKVVLLYGARCPELLLARELGEAKVRLVKNFQRYYFAETCEPTPCPSKEGNSTAFLPSKEGNSTAFLPSLEGQGVGSSIIPGRVNLEVLKDCPVSGSAVYYLAGPPAMVTALSNGLAQQGVSAHNVRVDAWE